MILDIALGVALGIVVAAAVLRYWRQLLSRTVLLIIAIIALAAIVWGGFFLWERRSAVVTVAGATLALAILYGLPFLIYARVTAAYPQFNALLKGEAPWHVASRLPLRLLVMSMFAVTVAGIGIAALFGGLWFIDYVSSILAHRS